MDKEKVKDIISTAFNRATGGGLEAIGDSAIDKLMTSEQVQKLHLTKEALIEAFHQDPRVTSVALENGKFHIGTEESIITFNLVFGDEGESPRFALEDESAFEQPVTTPDISIEEMARAFLDLCKSGATVEDLIETFLEDPYFTAAEYKNGRYYFETTEGPLDFWFPFLRHRSEEEKDSEVR